jgi:2-dehydropantoate 2-reductase
MEAAAQEVVTLADVLEIDLAVEDAGTFALQVAERTSANESSMLQDIRRRAPTEIDAICGVIVRIAQQKRIEMPINRTLWNLVRAKADMKAGG